MVKGVEATTFTYFCFFSKKKKEERTTFTYFIVAFPPYVNDYNNIAKITQGILWCQEREDGIHTGSLEVTSHEMLPNNSPEPIFCTEKLNFFQIVEMLNLSNKFSLIFLD